jgi:hypothetical protein
LPGGGGILSYVDLEYAKLYQETKIVTESVGFEKIEMIGGDCSEMDKFAAFLCGVNKVHKYIKSISHIKGNVTVRDGKMLDSLPP